MIVVKRITFVDRATVGDTVRRRFAAPRACAAVEEAGDLAGDPAWPDPVDHLVVVCLSAKDEAEWAKVGAKWLATPDHPEAVSAAAFECDGYRVQWRPGRAVLHGPSAGRDVLLAALAEFAFHEGELRRLEQALAAHEFAARADAHLAYRIRWRDRREWPRIAATAEDLARLRLTCAQLAPHLGTPARALPRPARRVVARLLRRADAATRLAALRDRLAACEQLYQGAADRIASYRWFREGHAVGLAIVFFLAIQAILIAAALVLRLTGHAE